MLKRAKALFIPETCCEQKRTDVHEYHIDTFAIGDDWKWKVAFLKEDGIEVVLAKNTRNKYNAN